MQNFHQLGLILDGKSPAPLKFSWEDIYFKGKKVGDMTNCVWSYKIDANIGYALISVDLKSGDEVDIRSRERSVKAKLVDLPFL